MILKQSSFLLIVAVFCNIFPATQDTSVVPVVGTNQKISPDDYPVTNKMLSYPNIRSGSIYSSDKVWLTNNKLKQSLVFELSTDKYRSGIYHFKNDDIPEDLIRRIELNVKNGDIASYKLKQKNFKGFIASANEIGAKYFTSYKGFKLDDPKSKAIGIYGIPNTVSIAEDKTGSEIETYQWNYPEAKVKNSFGYHVIMYFRSHKLIAMILTNDIP